MAAHAPRTLRILVARPGVDGDDHDAKLVARALADAGHEVVYAGADQTPDMIAAAAAQEAVDAVGLAIGASTHLTLFPAVIQALAARGLGDLTVFGGGSVPAADLPALAEIGVARVFAPTTGAAELRDWVEAYLRPRAG